MPANQMDLQGYARFLTACANDPRFTASTLIAAIEKENPDFGWFESLIYRFVAIPRTRKRHPRARATENAWFDVRPPQGPGRVDTFNPYKVLLEVRHAERPHGRHGRPARRCGTSGSARDLWLHWDGNNNSVDERNKSAAIGAGATPDSLDLPAMERIEDWIWT